MRSTMRAGGSSATKRWASRQEMKRAVAGCVDEVVEEPVAFLLAAARRDVEAEDALRPAVVLGGAEDEVPRVPDVVDAPAR